LSSEIECTGEVEMIPGESVVETLVKLTGENNVIVLGPTVDSTLTQLLSGMVPAGLAERGDCRRRDRFRLAVVKERVGIYCCS